MTSTLLALKTELTRVSKLAVRFLFFKEPFVYGCALSGLRSQPLTAALRPQTWREKNRLNLLGGVFQTTIAQQLSVARHIS
jgi:hypothetical protein